MTTKRTRAKTVWATKPVGSLQFTDLSPDLQDDVTIVVSGNNEDIDEEVREILNNGTLLPLVSIQPKSLAALLSRRGMSSDVVEKYRQAWNEGANFSPVVIDSRKRVLEGGHRATAAILAGIPRILAIDVAGARTVETEDPYARGHFFTTFVFGTKP